MVYRNIRKGIRGHVYPTHCHTNQNSQSCTNMDLTFTTFVYSKLSGETVCSYRIYIYLCYPIFPKDCLVYLFRVGYLRAPSIVPPTITNPRVHPGHPLPSQALKDKTGKLELEYYAIVRMGLGFLYIQKLDTANAEKQYTASLKSKRFFMGCLLMGLWDVC